MRGLGCGSASWLLSCSPGAGSGTTRPSSGLRSLYGLPRGKRSLMIAPVRVLAGGGGATLRPFIEYPHPAALGSEDRDVPTGKQLLTDCVVVDRDELVQARGQHLPE